MEERASIMEAIRLAGSIILENGGETYRVEDTVQRLGLALGAEDVQAFAVTSGVFITLTFIFGQLQKLLSRTFKSDDENAVIEEELISMVEEAEEDGSFDKGESDLIKSAIEFADLEVSDIFTPRIDITAV